MSFKKYKLKKKKIRKLVILKVWVKFSVGQSILLKRKRVLNRIIPNILKQSSNIIINKKNNL